jgi:hypothetical protein
MRLGIVTIQRDRAPWIAEWIAFHSLVGVQKFYFYAHNCDDNTSEVLTSLQKFYDITAFSLKTEPDQSIQLPAYQHAYDNFGHECDWFAFIDGDEFLVPTASDTVGDVLAHFDYQKMSALAVYWSCFGSSGHVVEPSGLITKNYRRRHHSDAANNRHVKSIVRGRQTVSTGINAHLFNTPYGTFDENLRPITTGIAGFDPTHRYLSVNHYAGQSREFFVRFKQRFGTGYVGTSYVHTDDWWNEYDRNDVLDHSIERYYERLENELRRIGHLNSAGVLPPIQE